MTTLFKDHKPGVRDRLVELVGGFCITPQKGKIQPVTDAFPLRMDRVH
jgi:hypothetical protein